MFDICHGCRRCFSLCNAFPTLFDAVDATAAGEVAAVEKKVFWEVVDHCYLCDMCFMTKCPYVPPHPWNVDFPHLMLRAKAARVRTEGLGVRERVLAATDTVGRLAGIPVVAEAVNAVNASRAGRALLEKALGVDRSAPLPAYHARTARSRLAALGTWLTRPATAAAPTPPQAGAGTRGPWRCSPPATAIATSRRWMRTWWRSSGTTASRSRCWRRSAAAACRGSSSATWRASRRLKEYNIPQLAAAVAAGYDIVAPIPSCVLMFKQELPLMYPEDRGVRAVAARTFDPFEYLMLRHAAGLLRTDFKTALGKVSYHVPCHLRVQNLGLKTRDLLKLVPGTTIDTIERCSGHNGTYGMKRRFRAASVRIGRPVMQRVQDAQCDHYASDCPMAGQQIESGLAGARAPEHPLRLLRIAYGL